MRQAVDTTDPPRAATVRPVDRVRGTHDQSPAVYRRQQALRQRMAAIVEAHGYAFIDTPVLEHTELFLRKSGGERIAQLYAFNHRGRELALRPEFTASVVRYYVDELQSEPLPVRLAYSGPVFRYEKPQAGRARQFTELGCELIGARGLLADVEVISLALECARQAGVARPRLVLGHIGVVIEFLAGLDVDQRAQDWLTWSMERLRKGDASAHELPAYLVREQAADDARLEIDDIPIDEAALTRLLRDIGLGFDGGVRSAEEIVAGVLAKRRRRHDPALLRDAAAFVARLSELRGAPGAVLGSLRALIASRGLDPTPLDELEEVVRLLDSFGQPADGIEIDLGMGRGLHYYTGMLFEVYAGDGGGGQLCGGGRYDDLTQLLGARQPTAACGFSCGVERIAGVSAAPSPETPKRALIVADGDIRAALALAAAFRARGWVAALDVRGRNPSATRRVAQRQGYALVATARGGEMLLERPSDGVSWLASEPPVPGEVALS